MAPEPGVVVPVVEVAEPVLLMDQVKLAPRNPMVDLSNSAVPSKMS